MSKFKVLALLTIFTTIFIPRLGLITDIFSKEGIINFSMAVIFGIVSWRCAILIDGLFFNIARNSFKFSVRMRGIILVLLSLSLTIILLNVLSRMIAGV